MTKDTLLVLAAIVLILPLLGFIFNVFFGKRLGKGSAVLASTILGIDLVLSAVIAVTKLTTFSSEGMLQIKFDWIMFLDKSVQIGIGIDNLAALMLIVVTLISFLVHIFSIEYMKDDSRFSRYFSYLGLFTFSMLGIVIANNFLNMYIFWELVGISSYLLIGFWYEKDSAADAGKKAFITNRIGDLGFFIGIMMIFFTYGSFMFDDVFAAIREGVLPFDSGAAMTAAGILIFCGAIGKSAQFPLHVWLPDAMEGPTPVSALIHAATMVAAGVYLTARVFQMFTADALLFIAYIGAITAFMAATIALTQYDFKKVLAYSTVSQLGYMVMGLGVGAFTSGFMHLVTHAWFKAALFLASGSVIHAMHHALHKHHDHHTDPQDIRNMGGLRKTMPLTYLTFLFVTLAISGVPLTSGFMSKDGILAGTLAFGQLTGHWLIPIAGFGAAGMTAFYMFRLTIKAFHGEHKTKFAAETHENNALVTLPLVVLAVLSIWIFYSTNPLDASAGWFHQNVKAPATAVPAEHQYDFLVPYDNAHTEVHATEHAEAHATEHAEAGHGGHHAANKFEEELHHAHTPAMITSLAVAGLGILFSFIVFQFKLFDSRQLAQQFKSLYKFSFNKWYFDELYEATVIGGVIKISKFFALFDLKVVDGLVNFTAALTKWVSTVIGHFDNIIIDGIVNLLANITGVLGALVRKMQTGKIQAYVAFAIVGVIILVYVIW